MLLLVTVTRLWIAMAQRVQNECATGRSPVNSRISSVQVIPFGRWMLQTRLCHRHSFVTQKYIQLCCDIAFPGRVRP